MPEVDWDALVEEEVPEEYTGPQWEELPNKAWVLGVIESDADLDWALPKVEKAGTSHVLRLTARCIGGDGLVRRDRHFRQRCRVEAFIEPNTRRDPPEQGIVGGKCKGLLNVLFAGGEQGGVSLDGKAGRELAEAKKQRTKARLKVTYNYLGKVCEREGIDISKYPSKGVALASAAAVDLRKQPRLILFKVNHRPDREDKSKHYVEGSTFEDLTDESLENRKIEVFDVDLFAAMQKEKVSF